MRSIDALPAAIRTIVVTLLIVALLPVGGVATNLRAFSQDAADVQRVRGSVRLIGVGKRVDVMLIQGERMRGKIREIADDHFVILVGGKTTPIDIAYDQVRQLKERRSVMRKAGTLASGVFYAVSMVGMVAVSCMFGDDDMCRF